MKRKKYYCSVRKAIIRIGVYGFIIFLLTAGQLSGSVVFADETQDSDVQTEQEESNTQVNNDQETLSSSEEIQSTSDSKEVTNESQDSSAETDSTEDVEAESSDEDVTEDDEDSEEDEEPSNHTMGEEAAKRLVDDPNSPAKAQSITPDRFNIGDNAYTRQDAIDVASYQSWMTPSDFQALRNFGVKGAVVKTTEYTNYTNPYATSQINAAKNAGMKVSVYHYAHFYDYNSGYNEGKYAAQVLKNLGLEKNIQIFADMEDNSTNRNTVKEGMNGFWKALKDAGYNNHNVYTYASYSQRDQVVSTVGKTNTWIAQYPYSPLKGGSYEKQWENAGYGAWQFSSTALFKGNPIDVSIDYNGLLTGTTSSGENGNSPQGPYHKYGKYVTITKDNYSIWQNFNWKKKNNSADYYGQTLEARGYYDHSNGSRYLSLYDSSGTWVGYINESGTAINNKPQGDYQSYGEYVTISKDNYSIWQNFNWKQKHASADYYGQTLEARGYYDHFNGSRYLSLYDRNGSWVGYINESGTNLSGNGRGGNYQSYNKFVTISVDNYDIWQDLDFSRSRNHSSDYYGQTLEARGYYNHFNGTRYLSLYDNAGTWVGYMNENGTNLSNGQQGNYKRYGQHVTISKDNYSIWQNFNWKKKHDSADYYGQTLEARGYYDHFNGSRFLSLYDNTGTWVGYINESGTNLSDTGKGGNYQSYNKFVTVSVDNYDIWQDFNFSRSRNHSSNYYGQTLEARGYYNHFNGSRYLSLYDNGGTWVGYMNENGTKIGNGEQGSYQGYGEKVLINKDNYSIWQNFNWKKKHDSADYYRQTLEARGYYNHFNGSRFLSLYNDDGSWIGYINENATELSND
ncbi:hypothetical protein C7H83_09090 [Tetragenococcus halophilus]|uniref:Lysozyme n=1 Tax=Tetragenococcus halophilus TaxID=51669 RepID=A0A3G5FJU3_TETHA|nr:GH25 family lysozyme [Tetragenococcus halophilus]AYW50604.1 hypothetical protein C7H83_09090 [Tetragenococcus halophilus]GBD64801.1 hypothetical protein TEHD23766T_2228 [Tetragenococcus halophilus subsp. flandriensis]